jgi:hypothetical protein
MPFSHFDEGGRAESLRKTPMAILQVSLLGQESIEKIQRLGLAVDAGDFAENITTRGIDLPGLPVGTRLSLGCATVEITRSGRNAMPLATSTIRQGTA